MQFLRIVLKAFKFFRGVEGEQTQKAGTRDNKTKQHALHKNKKLKFLTEKSESK